MLDTNTILMSDQTCSMVNSWSIARAIHLLQPPSKIQLSELVCTSHGASYLLVLSNVHLEPPALGYHNNTARLVTFTLILGSAKCAAQPGYACIHYLVLGRLEPLFVGNSSADFRKCFGYSVGGTPILTMGVL